MSETTDLRNVTKFDGQNSSYGNSKWSLFLSRMISWKLLNVLKLNQNRIEIFENAWIKKDARTMSVLSSLMKYSQFEYLDTCITAAEMWTEFSAIHKQKRASNKLMLTTKFHEYYMAAGDSIAQHITKIENMASQLKNIDENISNIMIMA